MKKGERIVGHFADKGGKSLPGGRLANRQQLIGRAGPGLNHIGGKVARKSGAASSASVFWRCSSR